MTKEINGVAEKSQERTVKQETKECFKMKNADTGIKTLKP